MPAKFHTPLADFLISFIISIFFIWGHIWLDSELTPRLCAQSWLVAVLRDPYMVQDIEPRLALWKASLLPTVLCLQPHTTLVVKFLNILVVVLASGHTVLEYSQLWGPLKTSYTSVVVLEHTWLKHDKDGIIYSSTRDPRQQNYLIHVKDTGS